MPQYDAYGNVIGSVTGGTTNTGSSHGGGGYLYSKPGSAMMPGVGYYGGQSGHGGLYSYGQGSVAPYAGPMGNNPGFATAALAPYQTPTPAPPPPPPPAATPAAPAAPTGPTPEQLAAQARADAIKAQMGAGSTYAQGALKKLGFADTYGLMDAFNAEMAKAQGNIPATAAAGDIGKYFNPEAYWNTALNKVTGEQRDVLNRGYTNLTTPGWQKGALGFADTADDAILASILGGQETDAKNALKAQLDRGQMSQGAYNYALNQLTGKEAAANSQLQTLGGGVLGKDRDLLSGIAKSYGDAISGYSLGQNLSMDDLKKQLATSRAASAGTLQGDILSALGGTKLFDIDALAAQAGQAAGASNTPLSAAFTNQPTTATVDPNRLTSTTGIF